MIYADRLPIINIGHQGENISRVIEIDCTSMLEDNKNATITLFFKAGDSNEEIYAPTIEMENNILKWTITKTETQFLGDSKIEIQAREKDYVLKSSTGIARVLPSLSGNEIEPPTPADTDWMERVTATANGAEQTANRAEHTANSVRQDADAQY